MMREEDGKFKARRVSFYRIPREAPVRRYAEHLGDVSCEVSPLNQCNDPREAIRRQRALLKKHLSRKHKQARGDRVHASYCSESDENSRELRRLRLLSVVEYGFPSGIMESIGYSDWKIHQSMDGRDE